MHDPALLGPRPRQQYSANCLMPRVLLRQVCHSLGEAHGRGLVHRDIKLANRFVCRMGAMPTW